MPPKSAKPPSRSIIPTPLPPGLAGSVGSPTRKPPAERNPAPIKPRKPATTKQLRSNAARKLNTAKKRMEDAAGEVREAERVLADTEDATRVVAERNLLKKQTIWSKAVEQHASASRNHTELDLRVQVEEGTPGAEAQLQQLCQDDAPPAEPPLSMPVSQVGQSESPSHSQPDHVPPAAESPLWPQPSYPDLSNSLQGGAHGRDLEHSLQPQSYSLHDLNPYTLNAQNSFSQNPAFGLNGNSSSLDMYNLPHNHHHTLLTDNEVGGYFGIPDFSTNFFAGTSFAMKRGLEDTESTDVQPLHKKMRPIDHQTDGHEFNPQTMQRYFSTPASIHAPDSAASLTVMAQPGARSSLQTIHEHPGIEFEMSLPPEQLPPQANAHFSPIPQNDLPTQEVGCASGAQNPPRVVVSNHPPPSVPNPPPPPALLSGSTQETPGPARTTNAPSPPPSQEVLGPVTSEPAPTTYAPASPPSTIIKPTASNSDAPALAESATSSSKDLNQSLASSAHDAANGASILVQPAVKPTPAIPPKESPSCIDGMAPDPSHSSASHLGDAARQSVPTGGQQAPAVVTDKRVKSQTKPVLNTFIPPPPVSYDSDADADSDSGSESSPEPEAPLVKSTDSQPISEQGGSPAAPTDDEEPKAEDDASQDLTAKRTAVAAKVWSDMSPERQETLQKNIEKQVHDWLIAYPNGELDMIARHHLRDNSFLLPGTADLNRELVLQIHEIVRGPRKKPIVNIKCRYHRNSRHGSSINDATGGGPMGATGIAAGASDEVRPGLANCGCYLEDILWEYLFIKTATVTMSPYAPEALRGAEDGWYTMALNPRLRSLMISFVKRVFPVPIDEIYRYPNGVKKGKSFTLGSGALQHNQSRVWAREVQILQSWLTGKQPISTGVSKPVQSQGKETGKGKEKEQERDDGQLEAGDANVGQRQTQEAGSGQG